MEKKIEVTKSKQHRRPNGRDRLRWIACTILAFLLTMALVGMSALLVIQWSCFTRGTFYKNMSSNQYYDNVKNDIYDNAEAVTIPIGLSLEVLEETISLQAVYIDVNGYIDASFAGTTYVPDTTEIKTKLEQNVREYLNLEGITPDQEQETNILVYVESITTIYTDTVQVPLLSYFMKARAIYRKIFPIGILTCLLFIGVSIAMIFKMHHWLHRALRYVSYSTIATMLMTAIVPIAILRSGFYKKIHLAPEYFYDFAMSYISNIFETFLYLSIAWGIVAVIIMVAIQMIKRSKTYYRKKSK